MEKNNLEYLKKSLKFLGFGTSLNAALESKFSEQPEMFKLGVSAEFNSIRKGGAIGKDRVNYELDFSKSQKSDLYFLNSLKTTLNDQIQNTFLLGKGNDVSAKEAYNLLRGASVQKKAIITDNFTLAYFDESGKKGQETKVSSTEEAQQFIKQNIDKNINVHGSYELYEKGYPLRTYEGQTGKDFTSIPDGKLWLSYDYKNISNGQSEGMNYLSDNFNKAIDLMNDLIKNPKPNHEVRGFKILNESTHNILFRFDKEGKELPLEAKKRSENIWIKLDLDKQNEQGNYAFKKFYPNYGFNLESELEKYPIKQMENDKEKDMLISSLGRGNTQKANLESGQSVFIEADPQFKKLNFYDMDYKKLDVAPSQTSEMNR